MKFVCDYMNYDKNFLLQEALGGGREERVIFADQVIKLNRRLRPERRDLVITVEAIYLTMRCKKNNQEYYKLTRRNFINEINSVALSTNQDNFIIFRFNTDDLVLENSKKTEIVAVLNEYYEKKTGRKITIEFTDSVNIKLKTNDTRTIQFRKDESSQQPRLKKTGKQLVISINSGLPKDTDTAPPGVSKPVNTGGGGVKRGGGGGGQRGGGQQRGGGGGGQRGGGQTGGGQSEPKQPQPQPVKQPQPPKQTQQPKAKAMYAYAGQTQDELTFKEGDILIIHKKDPGGWWEGELNGKRGWVPANYLEEI